MKLRKNHNCRGGGSCEILNFRHCAKKQGNSTIKDFSVAFNRKAGMDNKKSVAS